MAVYKTLDIEVAAKLQESGVVLACKKGCSFCCNQMITCTKMEMDAIIEFVNNLRADFQHRLKRRLARFAREWKEYYQETGQSKKDAMLILKDWEGKSCPFLNREGSCDIYPVRTIDCRTATSTVRCQSLEQPEGKRFRFGVELLANNIIIDWQEVLSNFMGTTAIHNWIALWQQRNWQPIKDENLKGPQVIPVTSISQFT